MGALSKKEYLRQYYLANREKLIARAAVWAAANPEKRKESADRWKARNPKAWIRSHVKRRDSGLTPQRVLTAEQKARNAARKREAFRSDPQRREYDYAVRALSRILTGRITGTFRGSRHLDALGCSRAELIAHIEAQFLPGMTWENRGCARGDWQFDHIKSAAEFDLTDPKQLKKFLHYTNVRPLWGAENARRATKKHV